MDRLAFCCLMLFASVGTAEEPAWVLPDLEKAPVGPPESKPEMDAAIRYLDANPGATEAPRVAFEVLIAATIESDRELVDDMRRRLALDYSTTIYGRYAMVTSKPQAYRELLKKTAAETPFTRTFMERFNTAAKAGFRQWEGQFMGDTAFVLYWALASRLAGDKQTREMCASHLRQPTNTKDADAIALKRTAEILYDLSLSESEASLHFHEIKNPVAVKFAEYFDSRLPEVERHTSALMEARVERVLEREQLEAARPLIEELIAAHGKTPKRLFWLGWCQAVMRDDAAEATLREVIEGSPKSEWAAPAREALNAAIGFDANLKGLVDGLFAVIREASELTFEQVQFKAETTTLRIDFNASLTENSFEISLRRNGQWLLAVRRHPERTDLWIEDDPVIHSFANGRIFQLPLPDIKLDPQEDRPFRMDWKWDFTSVTPTSHSAIKSSEVTLQTIRSLNPDFIRLALLREFGKGWLPAAVEVNEHSRVYRWIAFGVRRPEVRSMQVQVSSDHQIQGFETPELTIYQIDYGKAGSFEIDAPEWPEKEIAKYETLDPSVLFRVVAAATKIFMEDQPTATAEAIGDERR